MDFVIHGTKGGRRVFTPQKVSGLFDVTADGAKSAAIGQHAYGIIFSAESIFFSKYRIIRDVRGDKRIGFVGFSVSLNNKEKLTGIDIINLLDKVAIEYCQRYVHDNNLSEVTEDWGFLDAISNEYKPKLRHNASLDPEMFQAGPKDDAIIYFKDIDELGKYFDAPYQDEYIDFRQVLFINRELQGKSEDPRNAMRNSGTDLTGQIDLDNPNYKLYYSQNTKDGVRIEVKKNGNYQYNKSKIRRKNELEIVWRKRFYQTIIKRGKIHEIGSDYLTIDEQEHTVTIKDVNLEPESKTITFDVFTKKDEEKVADAEIQIDTQPWANIPSFTFSAEQLGFEHKIVARKGNNLCSKVEKITPINYNSSTLPLPLIEKKVVKIFVYEAEGNKDNIWDFKVWINNGKCNTQRVDEVEFFGEEIYQNWTITVEKDGYQRSEHITYNPAKGESKIDFELKKASNYNNTRYHVDAGTHGRIIDNKVLSSSKKDGSDVRDKIIANKGWILSGFELNNNTLIAQYERNFSSLLNPKVIAGALVSFLAILIGVWLFYHFTGTTKGDDISNYKDEIEKYIDGDSLMLDKLNEYKTRWEKLEEKFIRKSGGGWFGGEKDTDYTLWEKDWKPVSVKIEEALEKRKFINQKNFEVLKGLNYSLEQNTFKLAIEKIDTTKFNELEKELGDLSGLTLKQIAGRIEDFNNKLSEKGSPDQSKGSQNGSETVKAEKRTVTDTGSVSGSGSNDYTTNKNAQLKKIENELKSDTITFSTLNNYANQYPEDKINKSIQSYLKFWSMIYGGGTRLQKKSFDDLLKKEVKKDDILKDSKLKNFLMKICENSESFEKFNEIRGKSNCKSINELNEKLN